MIRILRNRKAGVWLEYGTLFTVIVVLGSTHASVVAWIIVGILYVGAMAIYRHVYTPERRTMT